MDFREQVIQGLDRLIESGKIEACISATLEQTVAAIIKDQLNSYGEFGQQLKQAVAKSLAIGEDLDLPSYNDAVLKIVRAQVEHYTHATIQKQVAENLEKLLKPAPERITLSELVEQYKEHQKGMLESGCVCYGERHAITVLKGRRDGDVFDVYLDPEANTERNQCEIRLGIHREQVYHLAFKNQNVERDMFVGPFFGFERMLFQMKAAQTKFVIDCEVDDLCLEYAEVD